MIKEPRFAVIAFWVFLVGAMMVQIWNLGYYQGIKKGHKEALTTEHVSEELEMACAGLWIGEQNRKYHEKENQK